MRIALSLLELAALGEMSSGVYWKEAPSNGVAMMYYTLIPQQRKMTIGG